MSSIPYASVVGSLMYVMVSTLPNIAHAVGTVRRYLSNLGKSHWNVVKWILRYLRGTFKLCIRFGGLNLLSLKAFQMRTWLEFLIVANLHLVSYLLL